MGQPLHLLVLLGVAATAFSCAADEPAPGAVTDQAPIMGGRAAPEYPAVGVVHFRSGSFGGGALIASNVVLTAAHVALGSVDRFYYGNAPAGAGPTFEGLPSVAIAEVALHPCYRRQASDARPAGCPGDLDVALVRLAEAITDVPPLPLYDVASLAAPASFEQLQGRLVTAVGFGCHVTEDGETTKGERRAAESRIVGMNSLELVVSAVTGIATAGDSGSPLLLEGAIVGTVRGSAQAMPAGAHKCARGREAYVRVDRTRAWIDEQMATWAEAANDADDGGPGDTPDE